MAGARRGTLGQVVDPRDKSQDWVEVKDLVAAGLLQPGTKLTPRQGSWTSREALVRDDGMLEVEGQLFGSPSGAGTPRQGQCDKRLDVLEPSPTAAG